MRTHSALFSGGVDGTLGAQRLEAYSHWRVPGEIYSETQRKQEAIEVRTATKTTTPHKVGTHASGPALGYNSKSFYRM